jgi:hypothetical protein
VEDLIALLQYLISGLTNNAIYVLIALGFGIIYNATTIINFAQGEMVMLGALAAISPHHLHPSLPLGHPETSGGHRRVPGRGTAGVSKYSFLFSVKSIGGPGILPVPG